MKYEVHVSLEYNGIVEAKDELEAKKIAREDACFFGDIIKGEDHEILICYGQRWKHFEGVERYSFKREMV